MTHLLFVILVDSARVPELLQAWHDIELPGVTVMDGVGAYRARTWLSEVGLGAVDRLFETEEVRRRTLLTAIDDEELLHRAIAEAERVVGGFENPDTGVLLALPVAIARGLNKTGPRRERVEVEPPVVAQPDWMVRRDTLVDRIIPILNLQPTIVSADTTLDQVAQALLAQPTVSVACVEAEDGRLIGLLDLETVANDLFFYILPEEFLSEVVDLERALAFAERSRLRTAADAMKPPVWVKLGETVKDAFRRMHDSRIMGLPVVNDEYCVVGYINILELLSIFVTQVQDGRPAGEPSP